VGGGGCGWKEYVILGLSPKGVSLQIAANVEEDSWKDPPKNNITQGYGPHQRYKVRRIDRLVLFFNQQEMGSKGRGTARKFSACKIL